MLFSAGVVHPVGGWSQAEVGVYIQDLLICGEMLIAAIVHKSAFDYRPFALWMQEMQVRLRSQRARLCFHQ